MKLTEGVDYYKENGNYVFTEDFLRRRGYCCKSGCRHCPYGFIRMDSDFSDYRFNVGDNVKVKLNGNVGEVKRRQPGHVYDLKFPGDDRMYYYAEIQLEAASVQH